MWTVIKWILIIWLGPHALALILRILAIGAVELATWLDKWPL